MIPKWRYVEYTDDGCARYECLQCYSQWEGRSVVGYIDFDSSVFKAVWKFCPYCGCEWTGSTRTEEDEYGPRRQKVRNAENSRRFDDRKDPPWMYWWAIECNETTTWRGQEPRATGWYPELYIPWWAGAAKVHRALRRERRKREGDTDWLTTDDCPYTKTCEYRVRIVKSLPTYGYNKVCYWVDKL